MRTDRIHRVPAAVLGGILVAIGLSGCEPQTVAATTPAAPAAVAASTYFVPYVSGNNYQFVLYSTTFANPDTIATVQAFDNNGNPLNPWTLVSTGPNAPVQNQTAMTITVLLTAGNGQPAPQIKDKPKTAPPAGPTGSGTVVITTNGGASSTIPVKIVTKDPCGLN